MTKPSREPASVPDPYYADDFVTIYCGDALQLLPAILEREDIGVMLTDPPYGIGWKQHGGGVNGKSRATRRHSGIEGDADTRARDAVLGMWHGPALVFGSFRAPRPPGVKQTLVFKKSPDAGVMGSVTGFRTDAEPVYLLGPWPKRNAHRSSIVETRISLSRLQDDDSHPHAKPVDVLGALIDACPPGTIVDPFMGAGATLRAAKDRHRRAIGIEIEAGYCATAARRCAQEVLAA